MICVCGSRPGSAPICCSPRAGYSPGYNRCTAKRTAQENGRQGQAQKADAADLDRDDLVVLAHQRKGQQYRGQDRDGQNDGDDLRGDVIIVFQDIEKGHLVLDDVVDQFQDVDDMKPAAARKRPARTPRACAAARSGRGCAAAASAPASHCPSRPFPGMAAPGRSRRHERKETTLSQLISFSLAAKR